MRLRVLLVGLVYMGCGEVSYVEPANSDPVDDLPPPADLKVYSGDACPITVAGENTLTSGGLQRAYIANLPANPEGAGVLFLWHGNGGNMNSFDATLDAAGLATTYNVITITPRADAGSLVTEWGVPTVGDPGPDTALFDDVLTCLNDQYGIDRRRVYSMGFSAGALWTSYLTMARGDYLAATLIFSGGTDGSTGATALPDFNPYFTSAYTTPVLMTHGGDSDFVAIRFSQTTASMATKLRQDGHTAIVCNHNGGHVIPNGYASWAWPFLDAHVFGDLPSPYADSDPSGTLPSYCVWR